jgi:hypothetical protein
VKTILVIYTNDRLTEKEAASKKRYAFNCEDRKVKVGDFLKIEDYETPVQVVEVLSKCYSHVNLLNGDLKNEATSTRDFPLRELVFAFHKSKNVVYCYRQ